MNKNLLVNQLQTLRLQLYEVAETRGSLTDPDVLALSEQVDQLIVVLQTIHREERDRASRKPGPVL
ncbi:aspartyl-phosphate phosphatase Spo0E family protein [Paenibacillus sambharensis]|uniref:Aspartyl-phosphate phosphatase Spo0E family protein n=1 Tax=Paenibacillus sambharensis TaxID=1803190 RepID=A0A2W1LC06_9BACL|nr:aspartyl-phosphate phosphatase Spo0E family protein [Paenibacillus sambharensis]PZD96413.1 aspartyl-phosphate phosphatase Spo0E family protein [Paenibacillus sambharensis]